MFGSGIDIKESDPSPARAGPSDGGCPRPFLRVFFRCSNQYLYVPRNARGSAYRAMCPRCGRHVDFVVGPGGTSQRFFELSC
ncbi:MAG TPA: hypothetical protein PKU91_02775 [Phycisphaerales bacterium]|nr:hypothetical protein [Phycisphaerae bacterium]HRJ49428.1 hypothetical protein [Phycisphaerales bacterium]